MATLISDIKTLCGTGSGHDVLKGKELAKLSCIDNAYLVIEGDRIAAYGKMKDLSHPVSSFASHISVPGRIILPSWCDSHTHLVFPGSREQEFIKKIKGQTYAQIAAGGGGILQSARLLHETTEDDLFKQSLTRLHQVIEMGTGAIEIKSGYGLSVEGELKMLRVIRRLKKATVIPIKTTFLGAHTIPEDYTQNRDGYIQLIIEKMLPLVASEKLADYIDVFCEDGFFTVEETDKICRAAKDFGLKSKIHANQLSVFGAVQAGIKLGAISVDHLEHMDEATINALAQSNTIGTLLPTAAFFLRMPFQSARQMIDSGCSIALASDYNPGSSPSGNMNFVVSLSCIQMKMLPEEAINAATINGAHAMELAHEVGTISVGKKANLILTQPIPSLAFLPYSFGNNLIERVMLAGKWVKEHAS